MNLKVFCLATQTPLNVGLAKMLLRESVKLEVVLRRLKILMIARLPRHQKEFYRYAKVTIKYHTVRQ